MNCGDETFLAYPESQVGQRHISSRFRETAYVRRALRVSVLLKLHLSHSSERGTAGDDS